jgi:hypothetical protein
MYLIICNLSPADLLKGLYSCELLIGFTGNDYLCMSGIIPGSYVAYKETYQVKNKLSYSSFILYEIG